MLRELAQKGDVSPSQIIQKARELELQYSNACEATKSSYAAERRYDLFFSSLIFSRVCSFYCFCFFYLFYYCYCLFSLICFFFFHCLLFVFICCYLHIFITFIIFFRRFVPQYWSGALILPFHSSLSCASITSKFIFFKSALTLLLSLLLLPLLYFITYISYVLFLIHHYIIIYCFSFAFIT